jgi:hypothetical protein
MVCQVFFAFFDNPVFKAFGRLYEALDVRR